MTYPFFIVRELTHKQQRFIEEYCVDFNATQAAIRAGYSEKTAYSIGQRLLKNVEIKAAIEARIKKKTMSADEALTRLADIARGTPAHFVDIDEDGNVTVNLGTESADANLHLIKKLKQTKHTTTVEDISTEEVRTEFELYDAQRALVDILKMHGKFVDRVEVKFENIDLSSLSDEELQKLEESEDPASYLALKDRDREGEAEA